MRGKKAKIINIGPMSTSFRLTAGISVIYESGSPLALQAAWAAPVVINSESVRTGVCGFGWDQIKLFLV